MLPVRIRGPVSQDNSMERYTKLFKVIFDGKLELDKWEAEALATKIDQIKAVSNTKARQISQTLIDAFGWRVSKKFLKPTIILGQYDELTYLALFPHAAWSRNKNDMDRYSVGTIEIDSEVEGRTSMVDFYSGEIRQSDPSYI